MTRKSKDEIERTLEELTDTKATDMTDTEAYALLVAAACGDERAAERFAQLSRECQKQLVG